MATLKLTSPTWEVTTSNQINNTTLWSKWLAIADGQAGNKTGWFLFSLVLQGVLFLPIPAVLMYYYDAPIAVLGVTMILFFANIIAGMGGSGIRTVLSFFVASVLVHVIMLAIFII
ncbi:hypothetical protein SAMN05216464_102528 [Mucilaginibacter pineti]|uniref:Uncharacterized protein n=1 Tax=Mucilaginibacter pineti TaxID=1391627 RepID=A0A1G6XGT0_9SPHI|nr:hypothetical protein [Mucilaginibacter pineti]SDD77272.1 hypothetical protein SAMN05216464_102528 [Mucilaginibacter pineti]